MSLVFRRGISTIIPPKVASPSGVSNPSRYEPLSGQTIDCGCGSQIGAAKDAARMARVVDFYSKLPRGAPPTIKPSGLLGRYQARYFGDKPSAMPLVHLIGGLILIGYAQNYYFHLRHHKNNAH